MLRAFTAHQAEHRQEIDRLAALACAPLSQRLTSPRELRDELVAFTFSIQQRCTAHELGSWLTSVLISDSEPQALDSSATMRAGPAFDELTLKPSSPSTMVTLRVGESRDDAIHARLREASRFAIEADRVTRLESANQLRLSAAEQYLRAVESALYRRLGTVFHKSSRETWKARRLSLEIGAKRSIDRSIEMFLNGNPPSLISIAIWLREPGPQPPELARAISDACGLSSQLASKLFLLGSIRNVLAHRAEYEENREQSLEAAAQLLTEEDHGATRRLLLDAVNLALLEAICREIIDSAG
jgi:hypothetical protein